jgi:hypothetical protein
MAEIVERWIFTYPNKCPLWIKKLEKEFEEAILASLSK